MEKTQPKYALVVFAVCVALLSWAWWGTLSHLVTILWTVDSFAHGLWVPFISLGLIWGRQDHAPPLALCGEWQGLGLLGAGALVWVIGVVAGFRLFEHIAFVMAVIAIVWVCFGARYLQYNLFAFLFLFLAIPFGDSLIPILQIMTAELVLLMLSVLQVPYEAEGVLITLSSGIFEVARACAGIKFLFTSAVMGVLLAHLAFKSWKGKFSIVAVSIALPILANAFRVLGILVISEFSDPDFAKGVDHIVYGWGFLSVILLLLLAIAYKFSDPPAPVGVAQAKSMMKHHSANIVIVFLVLVGVPFLVSPMQTDDPMMEFNPSSVTAPQCKDCAIRLLGNSPPNLLSLWEEPDSAFEFRYRLASDVIAISGALYCAQSPGQGLLQGANHLAGAGWAMLPGVVGEIKRVDDWTLAKKVFWKFDARRTIYFGYYINEKFVFSSDSVKLETAMLRLKGAQTKGAVFAISIPYAMDEIGMDKKIEQFLSVFPIENFLWSGLKTDFEGANACAV